MLKDGRFAEWPVFQRGPTVCFRPPPAKEGSEADPRLEEGNEHNRIISTRPVRTRRPAYQHEEKMTKSTWPARAPKCSSQHSRWFHGQPGHGDHGHRKPSPGPASLPGHIGLDAWGLRAGHGQAPLRQEAATARQPVSPAGP